MARRKQPFRRRLGNALLVVILLPFILPLALTALALYILHRIALYMLIWLLWLPKGKNILLVYSDSPIWHDYRVTQVLPLVQEQAVVLNWSERNKWPRWSFRVHMFHWFGG